jgi:hypothetical protein
MMLRRMAGVGCKGPLTAQRADARTRTLKELGVSARALCPVRGSARNRAEFLRRLCRCWRIKTNCRMIDRCVASASAGPSPS